MIKHSMNEKKEHPLTLEVTDVAKDELTKVLQAQSAKDKQLILYFRGYG